MLAEAVLAGAEELRRGREERKISPSGVSICPVRTYKTWKSERVPPTPQELLRMNDGHYQEDEMVDDLIRAGFQIKCRQLEVHIGGIMVGHIDGLIYVDNKWCLFDCKAMSQQRWTEFKRKGFDIETSMKAQQQLYLASDELIEMDIPAGFIYSKHKDTCRPYDLYFEYEEEFAKRLISQVGILIGGWIPEPVRIPLCSSCKFRIDCWKTQLIDFSGVKTVSLPEMVEQWKRGKHFQLYGKELVDEARDTFKEELADREVITIDDLKVQDILQHRRGISEKLFIEKYGAAALADVIEDKEVHQMRISEIEV